MIGRCERCGRRLERVHMRWARGLYGAFLVAVCGACEPKVNRDPADARASRREREEIAERRRRAVEDMTIPAAWFEELNALASVR